MQPLPMADTTPPDAQKHGIEGKRLFSTPIWGKAVLPSTPASASKAKHEIIATGRLDATTFPFLNTLHQGERIVLPLGDADVEALVNLVTTDGSVTRIGGSVGENAKGTFFLSQSLARRTDIAGQVLLPDKKIGYELVSHNGNLVVNKKPIESLLCLGIPPPPRPKAQNGATPSASPQGALSVPALDSLPGSRGVIYLDFDGATVTDPSWNSGYTVVAAPSVINGLPISSAQMTDVWRRVAEDYRPFNVSVTTVLSRYQSAPIGERIRCIITPTSSWYGNWGGVAYLHSYRGPNAGFSDDIPCWVFNTGNTSDIALAVSHEIGHTMGLSHDGAQRSSGHQEYYPGHGQGTPLSWGPIMGAPYDIVVTQWSKGEYPLANNTEDDLLIIAATIAEAGVVKGTIADDTGDTLGSATAMAISGTINQPGTIGSNSDIDCYQFKTGGGAITVNLVTDTPDPNLDSTLDILDEFGSTVATSQMSASSLDSTISTSLSSGIFYLRVSNTGRQAISGNPGYSTYGSMGSYTLTGSYKPLPQTPLIQVNPLSVTVNQGTPVVLKVVALSNYVMKYVWKKDGKILPGKTASTLVIPSAQGVDNGTYSVDVINFVGTSSSLPANVVVYYKPIVTTPPLPAALTANTGDNVSYSVTANGLDGVAPITYVWNRNGVAIVPAETNATLSLNSVDWFDGGIYTCTVTNAMGSTTSGGSHLTVTSAPLFTVSPPAVKHIPLGGTASVSTTVVGTAPITYQWYRAGGTKVPGATLPVLSWKAITAAAAGEYYLVATNAKGSNESSHMQVGMQDAPKITADPLAKVALNADDTLTLSCAASGSPLLIYHWQHNNIPLVNDSRVSGADTASLTITPVTWTDQGAYRCVVTNEVGSATSKSSAVSITSYPVILTPPSSIKIATGGTGSLKVMAGGTPLLKYQWFKGSTPVGAAPALTLTHATAANLNGNYTVTVTNAQSSKGVTTTPVTVTVLDAPKITLHPVKSYAAPTQFAQMSVIAIGGGNLTYQWQKNNKDVAGQTTPVLNLSNVALSDAGLYRCIVKNEVGIASSNAAAFVVLNPPVIVTQPQNRQVFETVSTSMSVVVSGSAPFSYVWAKDDGTGTFVPLSPLIPGSRNATLPITGATLSQFGKYKVTVSNAVGSVTSAAATLTVLPMPPPEITEFTPHQQRIDMRIGIDYVPSTLIIAGKYLNFVYSVRFGSLNASFTHSNDSELLVRIPQSLAVATPITIESRAGRATTLVPFKPYPRFFTMSTIAPINDNLIDAQFVVGTSGPTVNGPQSDNSNATLEPGEYGGGGGGYASVWYHWRPATSGTYNIDTAGTYFDSFLTIYTGPTVPVNGIADLTFLDFNFGGLSPIVYRPYSELEIYVNKGRDYYLSVASSGYLLYSTTDRGDVYLNFNRISLNSPAAAGAAAAAAARPGAKSMDGLDGAVGGTNSATGETFVPWLPAEPTAKDRILTATADIMIETAKGSDEKFSWVVYDHDENPIIGLIFDTKNNQVLTQAANGDAAPCGQLFVPGAACPVSFAVDGKRQVWSLSINGVNILEDQPLSASAAKSGFGNVGALWTPAPGATSGGTMRYGRFTTSMEAAP